jgi:hypothetical protein
LFEVPAIASVAAELVVSGARVGEPVPEMGTVSGSTGTISVDRRELAGSIGATGGKVRREALAPEETPDR